MVLLHILWMLLKFLLILLGIVLGLVLLVLLLILFCPIRYRADVAKETESFKEISAKASVSWLFRGVRLIIDYRDGKVNPDLRLFGISLMKVKAFFDERKKKKEQAAAEKKVQEGPTQTSESATSEDKSGQGTAKLPESFKEDTGKTAEGKTAEGKTVEGKTAEGENSGTRKPAEQKKDNQKPGELKKDSQKPADLKTEDHKSVRQKTENTSGSELSDFYRKAAQKTDISSGHQRTKSPPDEAYGSSFADKKEKELRRKKISGGDTKALQEDFLEKNGEETVQDVQEPLVFRLFEGLFDKIGSIFEKIGRLFERLGQAIEGLEKKKDNLEEKIDYWKDFASHPSIKPAISLIWRKAKLLLRHILPTKIAGNVAFGFEDPSVTGNILAIMGMTIPLHKNSVQIHPDFEGETHIEGTLWLKGRIYGIVFAITALRILLDNNIRYIYRRVKNKEPGTVPRT